ncbi:hypothetical protein G7067_03885 [Leucobacter insecticola]|uniref:Uncharacterized protein n=1 Tax=Leucobacter insecticola TaxID=2714934 RepID=A0A6G8FGW2_9MICO|nr:hypothetical protein G7067_03885 [Leucobacter insecticola]
MLQTGEVDLAIALADTVREHEKGRLADGGSATGTNVAIGRVYQNYLQCAVLADGPLSEISELRGKVVSTGASGSGSSFTTRRVLDLSGLSEAEGGLAASSTVWETACESCERGALTRCFGQEGSRLPRLRSSARRCRCACSTCRTWPGCLKRSIRSSTSNRPFRRRFTARRCQRRRSGYPTCCSRVLS